jgi:cyclophilin family peptidyl-prolyl cis-trans isomerase
MTIDTGKRYFATFKMAKGGEFIVELFADKAPVTVNNFVFLAQQGYYNGTTFHRVLDGFMAQGGDPTGTGMGGPGYQFEDEFSPDLTFDRPGLLAMANAGPNTNGSQFFITYAPTPHLNNLHTIFGEVVEGIDVVNGLTRRDPDQNPDFAGDAIETITISEE